VGEPRPPSPRRWANGRFQAPNSTKHPPSPSAGDETPTLTERRRRNGHLRGLGGAPPRTTTRGRRRTIV